MNFVRAFLASAVATGLSRVLGAARDVAQAAVLGASDLSDAFNIAFTIPNVFRKFVADEGLTGAMIPALARAEAEGGSDELHRLASAGWAALLLVNVALCLVGVALAEPLVLLFAGAWRDDPQQLARAVAMTRALFPFVGLVSVVSYLEGLLNYRGHFFVPKLSPAFVSLGIVAAAVLLVGPLGPAWALVAGTMGGGVAMAIVNVPPLLRFWGRLGLRLDLRSPRLRAIVREMGKVAAIGLFGQINVVVLRNLGTALGPGVLTQYVNATHLVDLAQGIVAVGIGSALLPNIAASVAEGAWERFRAELGQALRLAAFLLLPVGAVLVAFPVPVTAMLFRLGRYTMEDVERTASALQWMMPFVLAVGGINIVRKVYFVLEDRTTLLVVGAAGTAVTAALGFALVGRLGVGGLALALSVATVTQLAVYLAVLWRRLRERLGLGELAGPVARMLVACVPMAGVMWLAQPLGRWEEGPLSVWNWVVLAGAGAVGAAVYFGAAWALGVPETARVVGLLRRRLGR